MAPLRAEALERARNFRMAIVKFAGALGKPFLSISKRFHQIFRNSFVGRHISTSHVSSERPIVRPHLLCPDRKSFKP